MRDVDGASTKATSAAQRLTAKWRRTRAVVYSYDNYMYVVNLVRVTPPDDKQISVSLMSEGGSGKPLRSDLFTKSDLFIRRTFSCLKGSRPVYSASKMAV